MVSALDAGRQARVDAERQLLRTVQDTTLPAIVRATALHLLPPYLGPQSWRAVETCLAR